jgi:hypothetical protein
MKCIWENSFQRLIQAVYTEDNAFTLLYGPTRWQGVLNSLEMALKKVTEMSRVYRVEDDDGVIVGFAILNHGAGTIDVAHIRPSQIGKAFDFYNTVNKTLQTGSNYQSYVLNDCVVNNCAFIQATTTCNFLPIEFRVRNGVLEYKYSWSENWIPIFDIQQLPPQAPKLIELRKFGSWIQWRYVGTNDWFNLYNLEDFTGEEWDTLRLVITSNGQTAFDLAALGIVGNITDAKKNTHLFVNGQKRYVPEDYSIVGSILTWTDTDYDLETTDEVDLFYKKP